MIQYNLTKFNDESGTREIVSAFIDGEVYSMVSSNPAFGRAVEALRAAGDHEDDPDYGQSIIDIFDLANFANKAFHKVTERVSVREGRLFLDDNPVDASMSKVVIDYLGEGNDNALPLVRFLERLDENPSFTSRNQLWGFVQNHGIHLADDGRMVLYKGVNPTDKEGVYKSVNSGRAFVNGVEQVGQIHTCDGDVVTMPRREISDDPTVACHAGLHCGARSYASSFASTLITVLVAPEHVVCVPRDCGYAKVRVEEYEIMKPLGDREVDTVRWQDEDDEEYLYSYEDDDFGL